MTTRFDEILDECLNRITLGGETVESCLAHYPEEAAELEPYLRTVARLVQTCAFTPSSAAKEEGWQRLQAERRALQSHEHKRISLHVSWLPRWATALAAVILVILLGGISAVAASSNALPGDALYAVKRSMEQTRLALQPSPDDKVKLSLAHAERRTEEMAILIKEGKTPPLAQLGEDLRQNLDTAARVLSQVESEHEIAGVKSQAQQSVSQALSNLQVALQQAPEASRQAASDSFQASSQAYGEAVEKITAREPKPLVAAVPGTIQLLATDPPPPEVEKVLLTVSDIEVHLSSGPNSRWITITQESQTFDLLRIAEVQKFLGQKQVEPGTYTKVRFLVTRAVVVIGGVERPAKVPSGSLSLTRPFLVEEGKTTSVMLDFDGARSLHIASPAEFVLSPVVNVLVHRPGEQEKQAERRGRGQGPGRLGRAEFEGPVEALAPEYVVVQGVRIAIASTTRVEGKLEPGQKVEVEAVIQSDGTFLAIKVEGGRVPKPGRGEEGTVIKEETKPKEKDKGGEERETPGKAGGPVEDKEKGSGSPEKGKPPEKPGKER